MQTMLTARTCIFSVIQTALVPIGYPGPARTDAFHFDMYTATGMFSAILGIVNAVLLIVVFKEHTVTDDQFSHKNIQSAGTCTFRTPTKVYINPVFPPWNKKSPCI